MKKILITGKNSYIGLSLKNWLSRYPDMYAVDTVSTRNGDWERCSFSNYDVVFNVAGIAHVEAKTSMEPLYYKVNRDLCIALARKAKRENVRQFIFMSSMIVFSNLNTYIDRDTAPNPRNFYGKSKLQADNEIQKLNDNDFKVVSLRPPMVYGPNCKGNFQRLYDFALKSPFFPIYENQRSMIYIDNLCEFIRLAVDNEESGIFYPQNKDYVSVSKIVQTIAKLNGRNMKMLKVFNLPIEFFLKKINILNKIFGNFVYDKEMSNYMDYKYCVVDFYDSISLINEMRMYGYKRYE